MICVFVFEWKLLRLILPQQTYVGGQFCWREWSTVFPFSIHRFSQKLDTWLNLSQSETLKNWILYLWQREQLEIRFPAAALVLCKPHGLRLQATCVIPAVFWVLTIFQHWFVRFLLIYCIEICLQWYSYCLKIFFPHPVAFNKEP